jgi:hypothetical protein
VFHLGELDRLAVLLTFGFGGGLILAAGDADRGEAQACDDDLSHMVLLG